MRKVISLALVSLLLLTLAFGASAEEAAVSVFAPDTSSKTYPSLTAALEACGEGDTVVLNADVTENVTVTGNAVIDGNGHTLNGQLVIQAAGVDSTAVSVSNLKIQNADKKNGCISLKSTCSLTVENCELNAYDFAIFPLDDQSPNSDFTVKNCKLNAGMNAQVFYAKNSQTWYLEDCVLTSPSGTDRASIQTKGAGAKVTMKNCTVTNDSKFCIASQTSDDEFTLIGGSYTTTGGSNPCIRAAGKLTVDGASVTSTVTNAILTYSNDAAVEILDGVFAYTGASAVSVVDGALGTVSVRGGKFQSNGQLDIVVGTGAFVYAGSFENTGSFDIRAFANGGTGDMDTISFPDGQKTVTVQGREKPETTKAPETTRKPVTTKAPVTTSPVTTANAGTQAHATEAPEQTGKTEEKGCGSLLSCGVLTVLLFGAAVTVRKKD